MKDHATFLRAASFFARERSDVRFVCVGDGTTLYREQLQALSRELGLAECLRWVGFRDDIAAVYNSLDLACSSSLFGEGFSNAIAEAMACGVPCVVTDVGDSAAIVGATGEVVPGGDPQALANGWGRLRARLQVQPDLRAEARNRIAQHFGVASLVERTSAALHSVLP
jgi:glycosyltransferase involved in cell wall biosynthesis